MPQDVGVIGDTAGGEDGRTEGVAVNYWGPNIRRKWIWLPKRNADTNTRLENLVGAGFSEVLTRRGNSYWRPEVMFRRAMPS